MHTEWVPILALNSQVSGFIHTNYCSLLSWLPWTHNCNFGITADKQTVILCCFNLYVAVSYWLLSTALFRVLRLLTSRVDTWPIDLQKQWIENHPLSEGKQLPNTPNLKYDYTPKYQQIAVLSTSYITVFFSPWQQSHHALWHAITNSFTLSLIYHFSSADNLISHNLWRATNLAFFRHLQNL